MMPTLIRENTAIKAPRGNVLTCKGWQQEAIYRCLLNNLEVAEKPDELVVYGGRGKAARDWECFDALVATLMRLEDDETLVVQSGKPVAVFTTHPWAPRAIISNAMLVPAWSTPEQFWELERQGLTMYGQMTAGSWVNIGAQGIIQGTFETFAAAANQYFDGTLEGRIVLTGGLGMFSGILPLAVSMNGGVTIAAEVERARIDRRLELGYVDVLAADLDEAARLAREAAEGGEARAIAVVANAAEMLEYMLASDLQIDVVTDQTSAHDLLHGYVPLGLTFEEALELRASDPTEYVHRTRATAVRHVEAMVAFHKAGKVVFDYGNNLRQQALNAGYGEAFVYPGFCKAFLRPLFCEGRGPYRWICLSGDPSDQRLLDDAVIESFPDDGVLIRWIDVARKYVPIEGLPARVCYMGYGERDRFGVLINQLVGSGELKAPVVISRDHLDSGSVASPNRETEGMLDGSDAIADWAVLNFGLTTACGATWVAMHNGGGVGIGYATHAGMAVVCDGTEDAARRIQRVLTVDPGIGVVRHADAGYDDARHIAREHGLDMPMLA
jgi:urocanate hydratase